MLIYNQSELIQRGTKYYAAQDEDTKQNFLCIQGNDKGFIGETQDGFCICPQIAHNADALRERLPWLNPQRLGLATSFGFGDRLGVATPGHVAAVKGTGVAPIFAQQSVRENRRTGRNPQVVLDDAVWSLFQEGWREPWGADADHVKEISDLGPFIDAGYTYYTIDPNQYVDRDADTDSVDALKQKIAAHSWTALGIALEDIYHFYASNAVKLDGYLLEFREDILLRAFVKYGRAIIHSKTIADHLTANLDQFDLEVSVDETNAPTSIEEHYFIANELRRLEVPFVSLAPRFSGKFEKGVDYIGDIDIFNSELDRHVAVMHQIGGYKLSIHTGSDKFSIYPSIAEKAKRLVHVKTAGTSYLEALRVIAEVDAALFREILDFARSRYEADRTSYHVSGELKKVHPSSALGDDELMALFDQSDARQVLHVTFGSVLDRFGVRLQKIMVEYGGLYRQFLEKHFTRHLAPFVEKNKHESG